MVTDNKQTSHDLVKSESSPNSPFRLVMIIAGMIFSFELVTMLVINFIFQKHHITNLAQYAPEMFLDSTLLLMLLSPWIYLFIYRPLNRQLKESIQTSLALKDSEEQYRAIFNEARDGIVLINTVTGEIAKCNPEFERQTGREEQGLKNMKIWELRPPEKTEAARSKFREIKEKGSGGSGKLEFMRPDSTIVPIEFTSKVISLHGNEYLQSISRDISERIRAEESLTQKSRHIQQILDALPCFAMLLNSNRVVVASNKVAREGGAYPGKRCFATLAKSDSPCPWCRADLALKSGEFQHIQTWGHSIYWDTYWIPLESDLYLHFAFDITANKKAEDRVLESLREKEVLLAEIHHRVKNNMAIIAALMNLQFSKTNDEQTKAMFQATYNRIRSMALVHEKLYQHKDLSSIDFGGYVKDLISDLVFSYGMVDKNVELKLDIDDITLGLDALIPCGLIMNELVSNSLEYAFEDTEAPEIAISLKGNGKGKAVLSISDNGKGFPGDMDTNNPGTLGLRLVNHLAAQLGGEASFIRGSGTEIKISFSAD
ncbi:MAG TPA: PAS domain S-box protein [Nitrospirae bacterium]|nr:PAS domain S-box protein [Nitrospirota bacterium]